MTMVYLFLLVGADQPYGGAADNRGQQRQRRHRQLRVQAHTTGPLKQPVLWIRNYLDPDPATNFLEFGIQFWIWVQPKFIKHSRKLFLKTP